jgi:trigger factor
VKSTVENLGPTRVRLAIELPFSELKPSLDSAYKKIGSQLRVPGFRPGKAPARVIDQRVGRAAVLEEAVNDALPKAYGEAVRETGVKALGQPDIEVTQLEDGELLSFTAEVDIRPEITLPDTAGIEVSVENAEVQDADVDEQLESLRDRFGSLTGVERPVENGDYVALDLVATVDGEEVEGGSATNLSHLVGSNDLVDGLDEAIVGKAAGETATFETTLRAGEHAGAQAEIKATVNSVKVKDLPAADDEFAQLASEFDTIDELRADLRERLGRVKSLEQGAQARDAVLEKLLEATEFELPESVVTSEVDYREHDVIHSLNHDDAAFAQFLLAQGQTQEEFRAELREAAEKSVKAQFILDAVADAEELTVGDAELTSYLLRQAARYNIPPQEFANQVVQAGNLPALVADVRRNKALATVLESAKITDASGNAVDLSALSAEDLAAVDELGEDEASLADPDAAFGPEDHSGHDHAGHDHDHDHGDHGHDHG